MSTDDGSPAVIEAEGLSRRFGATTALRDVSFRIPSRRVHALIGPNGAGKTTLLRIIAGITEPSDGSVTVLGASPGSSEIRRQIGWIPSGDRSLYLRLSGYENLLFFGRLHGLSKREASDRARQLLERVGLGGVMTQATGLYSHGMQKRTVIARAFLTNPRVLLFDEATHDLDPAATAEIVELVRAASVGGTCVLWATQRIDELRGFADSVTLLASSGVLFHGSLDDFVATADGQLYVLDVAARAGRIEDAVGAVMRYGIATPGDRQNEVLLQLHRGAVLGDAVGALSSAGFAVTGCREARQEIEEAFLTLTKRTRHAE